MNIVKSLISNKEDAMNPFENECCEEALKKRNPDLYDQFAGSVKALSNLLDVATPATYTFHGKKHIEMVKQYVGRLLGEKRIKRLTDDELYILLMGVLCHDLGMTQYDWEAQGGYYVPDRENHNIASYMMVYDQPKNRKNENLQILVPEGEPKYCKAIAELCLGHRDHKDENNKKVHTLSDSVKIPGCDDDVNINSSFFMSNNTEVHVEYLTAILRLADEIDVTNQRAPRDVEMNLRSFITDETKKHWNIPGLIDHVEIKSTDPGKTSILLVPDITDIKARSKDPIIGVSLDQLLSLLFERLEKIREEIVIINKITASNNYFNTGLSVEFNIGILYDDDTVTEEKYNEYLIRVHEAKEKADKQKKLGMSFDDYEEEEEEEETPTERFNKKIERLKEDKGLLECSNFEFPFGEYSHYFINTQLLLTNGKILDDITELFQDHYSDKNIDCVIGLGKAGIILAPNLSLKLNCNSSYMICKWESSTEWEQRTSVIENARNVLMILDVLSTGTVTEQSLNDSKIRNNTNLENIYIGTVFCTNEAVKRKLSKKDKVKEIYSINDNFQFRTYRPIKDKDKYDHDDEEDIISEEMEKEFNLLPRRRK